MLSATGREIAKSLGYPERPADSAYWFGVDPDYFRYSAQIPSPERFRRAGEDFPSPLRLVYRQSPQPLQANFVDAGQPWFVQADNPVANTPGDLTVALDTQGRLQFFRVVPYAEHNGAALDEPSLYWPALFERAGLDFSQAKTAPAGWYANQMMDQQFAWESEHEGEKIQVHGGVYKGRVVFFEVFGPWDPPVQSPYSVPVARYVEWIYFGMVLCFLSVTLFVARRNMQLGRGDSKGALRGAIAIFAVFVVWMLLASHHSPDPVWLFEWWQVVLGRPAGLALQWWLLYMALEPYIRRVYPQALISWSRMIGGNPRNPLVGRDILMGVGFGALVSATVLLMNALPSWISIKGITPVFYRTVLRELPVFVGNLAAQLTGALIDSLGALTLVFLAWKLFRSKLATMIALGAYWTMVHLQQENVLSELPLSILAGLLLVLCLLRCGLLGLIVATYTSFIVAVAPLTTDFSRWYAPRGVAAMLVIFAIAAYGFWISTSGHQRLGTAFED